MVRCPPGSLVPSQDYLPVSYRLHEEAHLLGTAGEPREVLDGEEHRREVVHHLQQKVTLQFANTFSVRDESCHDDEGGRLVLLAAVLLVHDVELGVGAGTEVGWVRKCPTILCDGAGRPTTEISDAPPANLSEEYAQKRRTAAVGLLALRGGSV